MSTALLDEIGDALERDEIARTASRDVERDSLDWPELRRAILAYGGIGPSTDWPRDWYPADLYRKGGSAPDVVAAEALHPAPWGEGGDDAAMFAYLQRSHAQWERFNAGAPRRAAKVVPVPATRAPGTRSFADLVADLKRKHGDGVDLAGLRSEYVSAYETGERVEVEREGRTYRGTVGATRNAHPRFVLLLSLDL